MECVSLWVPNKEAEQVLTKTQGPNMWCLEFIVLSVMRATEHDLCCETYNIHDSQDVLLDVSTSVVTHHHLVGHHESLYVALAAN